MGKNQFYNKSLKVNIFCVGKKYNLQIEIIATE